LKQPLQVSLPWLLEVTTTSLGPKMVEAGVVPVTSVVLTIVRLTSSLPPMITLVTSMTLVPVIVTLVPPATGPVAGLKRVTPVARSSERGGVGRPHTPRGAAYAREPGDGRSVRVHHVDLTAAVVAREGDLRSVGRPDGREVLPRIAGNPSRARPVRVHCVDLRV